MKYQDFAIAVIIWSPLGILVSGEVWMRLLVVEVAGKVMKELWMFPAEQSQFILLSSSPLHNAAVVKSLLYCSCD